MTTIVTIIIWAAVICVTIALWHAFVTMGGGR
jgi:hypothetical protein